MRNYLILALAALAIAGTSCNKTPEPEPVFTVTATPLSFAATPEGTKKIAVKAENLTWTAAVNTEAAGWLSVQSESDEITVTATANETTEPRNGTITVTPNHPDFEPVTITVSQLGEIPVAFSVPGEPLSFTAAPEASQTIAVTALNVTWAADVNDEADEWLSVETVGNEIAVTAVANETAETRNGVITVTPDHEDFEPVTIAVSQSGEDRQFSVTATPLTFAATPEGTQAISVTAQHVAWTVSVNAPAAEWLHAEAEGNGITVSADANGTTEARNGTITVTPDHADFEPVTVAVSQAGKEIVPELPAEVEFNMIYSAEYNGDKFGNGGGHFVVTFMNVVSTQNSIFESFTIEGFMPLAEDPTAGFVPLATGMYTWEQAEQFTGTPFTFLSHYGVATNAGSFYTSTLFGTDKQLFYAVGGGNIVVSDAGSGNTKIVADVVNEEGRPMKLSFTGPLTLENTAAPKEATYDVTFTSCQRAENLGQYFEQPIREFELQFTKRSTIGADNISEELILRFNADLDASADGQLPTGRYFPFTRVQYARRAPFTYMRGGSAYGMMAGSRYVRESQLYGSTMYVFFDQDGGYIDVARNDDGTYTIAVRVIGTGADTNTLETIPNVVVNCDFTGPLNIR